MLIAFVTKAHGIVQVVEVQGTAHDLAVSVNMRLFFVDFFGRISRSPVVPLHPATYTSNTKGVSDRS